MGTVDNLRNLLLPETGVPKNTLRLVAILAMSDAAERETDPFRRRVALNELQAAIQAIRCDIEVMAEGMVFVEGGDEE